MNESGSLGPILPCATERSELFPLPVKLARWRQDALCVR